MHTDMVSTTVTWNERSVTDRKKQHRLRISIKSWKDGDGAGFKSSSGSSSSACASPFISDCWRRDAIKFFMSSNSFWVRQQLISSWSSGVCDVATVVSGGPDVLESISEENKDNCRGEDSLDRNRRGSKSLMSAGTESVLCANPSISCSSATTSVRRTALITAISSTASSESSTISRSSCTVLVSLSFSICLRSLNKALATFTADTSWLEEGSTEAWNRSDEADAWLRRRTKHKSFVI